MQTQNPWLDDISRLMTGAMGVAQGAAEEARGFVHSQIHRVVADLDLARRDEFEVLKALVAQQNARIVALEAALLDAQSKLK